MKAATIAAVLVLAGCATSTTSTVQTIRPCGAVTLHFDLVAGGDVDLAGPARRPGWTHSGAASKFHGAGLPHRPRADRRPPHLRPATFSGRRPGPSPRWSLTSPSCPAAGRLWCSPTRGGAVRTRPSHPSPKPTRKDGSHDKEGRENPPSPPAVQVDAGREVTARPRGAAVDAQAQGDRSEDPVDPRREDLRRRP